mmetsp:Transcript_96664/g.277595  ORF Transcript_96664/g.277595 Transcript_96664/m.277595 type:complete len:610 (+) Transcript_96664:1-1830(+)
MRGCVALGPAHAQNDLIAITLLYPMLLCLIWTVVFIAVVILRYSVSHGNTLRRTMLALVAGAAFLVLLAWLLCNAVGRGQQPLLVTFVWLHLCRQVFRISRRWVMWGQAVCTDEGKDGRRSCRRRRREGQQGEVPSGDSNRRLSFALDPNKDKELRRTYSVERKIGRVAIRVLVLICVSFASILASCVLMAGIQQRVGLFLSDIVWWRPIEGGVEVVNSGASFLTLSWPNTSLADKIRATATKDSERLTSLPGPEDKPHYAICGHTWHGLQLVDYAMMSLVTYMEPEEKNALPTLVDMLFPHKKVRIIPHDSQSKKRRWLEFEVETCDGAGPNSSSCRSLTVVAVSGTDPTRIVDYAENLRMWTEPVALQILSAVFPTVRIWPRETTSMVIGGIHRILKSMDVSDDQWHYREMLDFVRELPEDRNVVITGHSLGGGISLVIGALTGRLAVAIQPPGVYHSLAKHEAQQATTASVAHGGPVVHKRSVSLVFEGDWIQNFDGHGGLVQTMNCDQSAKSVAVGCHLLEGAICHLMWHCGDKAQRFATCQHDYHPTSSALSLAKAVVAFLQESWKRSELLPHWDSVVMAGVTVSAMMVARYGPPTLPRVFLSS